MTLDGCCMETVLRGSLFKMGGGEKAHYLTKKGLAALPTIRAERRGDCTAEGRGGGKFLYQRREGERLNLAREKRDPSREGRKRGFLRCKEKK